MRRALARDQAVAHHALAAQRPLALAEARGVADQHAMDRVGPAQQGELGQPGAERDDVAAAQAGQEAERVAPEREPVADRADHAASSANASSISSARRRTRPAARRRVA